MLLPARMLLCMGLCAWHCSFLCISPAPSLHFTVMLAGIDIHPMTLEINFKIPFMREFLLLHGVVDASKSACLMTLGKGSGQAILLAVGGAQESLLARPGTYDIVRRGRRG
jgi:2-acylglycerol O-acyltransferase 2